MRQRKLEEKVIEIFERQGFELEALEKGFNVKDSDLVLKVFSSERFSVDEILDLVSEEDTVFVDKDLEDIEDLVENDVSIIREKVEKDFDLPSFEVIGHVAVINDLADVSEDEAVEGILYHQPNVETIILKEEGLSGEFRVGDYRKLYGAETETVHKEFGARLKVDPTKVYFSERFSTERNRVISQIGEGEEVLVMFAGAGPFAVMAGKNSEAKRVVGVEKNPVGADYMKENTKLNKLEGRVEGIEGDVIDVVPELGDFDRVVMPLPGGAQEFLGLAFEHVKDEGVIHYYRFLEDENWATLLKEIDEAAKETGKSFEILDKVICGNRAPNIDRVCIDIKVL